MHLTDYLSNSKNWNRFAIGLLRCMHRVTRKYADLHKLLLFLVALSPAVWGAKAIQKMFSRSISLFMCQLTMINYAWFRMDLFCSSKTVRKIEMLNFYLLISPSDLMIFLAFNI